jgi:hypothetical protein
VIQSAKDWACAPPNRGAVAIPALRRGGTSLHSHSRRLIEITYALSQIGVALSRRVAGRTLTLERGAGSLSEAAQEARHLQATQPACASTLLCDTPSRCRHRSPQHPVAPVRPSMVSGLGGASSGQGEKGLYSWHNRDIGGRLQEASCSRESCSSRH